MAAFINGYVTAEKLREILQVIEAKKEKGFAFTVAINDEPNKFNQNVQFTAAQSKEDRDANKAKYYWGNGAVTWVSDKGIKALKAKNTDTGKPAQSGLPF